MKMMTVVVSVLAFAGCSHAIQYNTVKVASDRYVVEGASIPQLQSNANAACLNDGFDSFVVDGSAVYPDNRVSLSVHCTKHTKADDITISDCLSKAGSATSEAASKAYDAVKDKVNEWRKDK